MPDLTFLADIRFPVHFAEAIGALGFVCYISNYVLLTTNILTNRCLTYFVINFSAASCVLFGLALGFNLASALIQSFWILISGLGIFLRLRERNLRAAPDPERPAAPPESGPFR